MLPPGLCEGAALGRTALAFPGQNSRHAVYGSSVLCVSYTFLMVPVLRTDLRSANLCMDMSITENDTQLFAKSCVSL